MPAAVEDHRAGQVRHARQDAVEDLRSWRSELGGGAGRRGSRLHSLSAEGSM